MLIGERIEYLFRQHKRGEIIFDENGKRQKYDGHSWRVLCENHLCPRIAIKSGLCRIHRIPTRKRSSTEVAAPVEQTISEPPASSICTSSPEVPPSQSCELSQLKKGDIQLVRQQWNGTKWYSLCHYPNESCSRRSAGIKYQHLCHIHYKEYIDKQKNIANSSESAPTAKRSRSTDERSIVVAHHSETSFRRSFTCSNSIKDLLRWIKAFDFGSIPFIFDSFQLIDRFSVDVVDEQHSYGSNETD